MQRELTGIMPEGLVDKILKERGPNGLEALLGDGPARRCNGLLAHHLEMVLGGLREHVQQIGVNVFRPTFHVCGIKIPGRQLELFATFAEWRKVGIGLWRRLLDLHLEHMGSYTSLCHVVRVVCCDV